MKHLILVTIVILLTFSCSAEDIYITMDFKDADILNVLKVIAKEKNLNIIAGNDVRGTVTANFTNVKFEDALDSILSVNGYSYEKRGNILKVMPTSKYEQLAQKNAASMMQTEIIKLQHVGSDKIVPLISTLRSENGKIQSSPGSNVIIIVDFPQTIEKMLRVIEAVDIKLSDNELRNIGATSQNLESRVFILKNAKAEDIMEVLKPLLSGGGNAETAAPAVDPALPAGLQKMQAQNSAKPSSKKDEVQGKIMADTRTNSLIVVDRPLVISQIEQFITILDRKVKQVMIEAKILELSHDKGNTFGIDSIFAPDSTKYTPDDPTTATTDEESESISTVLPGSGLKTEKTYRYPKSRNVARLDTVDINGLGLTLGGILKLGQLDAIDFGMVLNIIKEKTKSKLLSSPKIATLENEEAMISVTTKMPYQNTQSSSESGNVLGTNVEYKDIPLEMIVTPSINDDGDIKMKIDTKYETRVGTKDGEPIIDSRAATTNVVCRNGNTIVIGGLIRNEEVTTRRRVPLLSGIPIVGGLFKKNTTRHVQSELLIFITPRIIDQVKDTLTSAQLRKIITNKFDETAAESFQVPETAKPVQGKQIQPVKKSRH